MANHKSSKKRIRRNTRFDAVNTARRSRIRRFVKKVELAISAGDKDAAAGAMKEAQPEMQRGVTRGVLHQNTAARKISRLNARIKAMG